MIENNFKSFALIILLCSLIGYVNIACKKASQASESVASSANQQQQSNKVLESPTPMEPINPLTTDELGGVPNGAKAWKQYVESGRYRIANENDFNLPSSELQKDVGYLHYQNKNPFMHGDINKDGLSKDCAVIVVDTTINSENRFGVVIFNQSENKESTPQPNWLYRAMNLSSSVFGWSRDGLSIRSYKEDGSSNVCLVNWNKQKDFYSCK